MTKLGEWLYDHSEQINIGFWFIYGVVLLGLLIYTVAYK